MVKVFWGGKLSPLTKIMVDMNNALAWMLGQTRNTAAMKHRMRLGYSGTCSGDVDYYDERGAVHYLRVAKMLLDGVDIEGRTVLDVGCGTGIVSMLALERRAAKVTGIDLSRKMVNLCKTKAAERGFSNHSEFKQADAENLKIEDNTFDVVVSNLVLGLVPNQQKAVAEMSRVLKPGGYLGITTHGPRHYWEACNATFKAVTKRHALSYRLEFWPCKENRVKRLLYRSGLNEIKTLSIKWQEEFPSGEEAYDFIAATSSSWWLAKIPAAKRKTESNRIRQYFKRKGISKISFDVIMAYGRKKG